LKKIIIYEDLPSEYDDLRYFLETKKKPCPPNISDFQKGLIIILEENDSFKEAYSVVAYYTSTKEHLSQIKFEKEKNWSYEESSPFMNEGLMMKRTLNLDEHNNVVLDQHLCDFESMRFVDRLSLENYLFYNEGCFKRLNKTYLRALIYDIEITKKTSKVSEKKTVTTKEYQPITLETKIETKIIPEKLVPKPEIKSFSIPKSLQKNQPKKEIIVSDHEDSEEIFENREF